MAFESDWTPLPLNTSIPVSRAEEPVTESTQGRGRMNVAQDTVLVPVAQVADSLRAVLESLNVRLTDTVRVVGPAEGLSVANILAGIAIVVTGIFSLLVFRLQREQNRLQRAQAEMVERHERERRELEEAIQAQRTEATDKHIGWLAFKLSGQLRGWLEEKAAGQTVDELAAATRRGQPRLWGVWIAWAESQSSPQRLGAVEKGVEAIMEAAAVASPGTARIAGDACRLFYQARSDLRNGIRHVREQDGIEQVAILSGERPLSLVGRELFFDGYNALKTCIETLEQLIPAGLRGRAAFLSGSVFVTATVRGELSVGPSTPESDGPSAAGPSHENEAQGDG